MIMITIDSESTDHPSYPLRTVAEPSDQTCQVGTGNQPYLSFGKSPSINYTRQKELTPKPGSLRDDP